MYKTKDNTAGPYKDKLDENAKKRYEEKVKAVKGLDPYEHKEWTKDVSILPNFQHAHIYNYMILSVSAYTHEIFSNFKALQQAQVQFTDGWVQDLEMFRVDHKTIVRSKVNHSMRLSQKPLLPWVILKSTGEVESAHCTCMAGVAEKCVHVAALLYKIDTAVRLRGNVTPTDVQAYWIMPSNVNKVQGVPGHTIDYTTSAARKRALDQSISEGQTESSPPSIRTRIGGGPIRKSTLAELKPLTDIMHAHRSGLCSVMEEFCHQYADPVQPRILPKSLLRLYDPQMRGSELSALLQHSEHLKHHVAVSDAEAEALEEKTREQHKSEFWHTARAGRITASNVHAVVSTSIAKPALSTVKKVCYPQKQPRQLSDTEPEPIKWGKVNEDTARECYISQSKLQHRELKVKNCGFIINPSFPELGATPDALVNCECCGKGCVEIKCPYKHRDHDLLQACEDNKFCLHLTDGIVELKQTHMYYKQVQTQIFVTNSQFCDFVLWTTKTCVITRVMPDVNLWGKLLPVAQDFFYNVVLPELLAHHYTHPVPSISQVEPSAELAASIKRKKKAS